MLRLWVVPAEDLQLARRIVSRSLATTPRSDDLKVNYTRRLRNSRPCKQQHSLIRRLCCSLSSDLPVPSASVIPAARSESVKPEITAHRPQRHSILSTYPTISWGSGTSPEAPWRCPRLCLATEHERCAAPSFAADWRLKDERPWLLGKREWRLLWRWPSVIAGDGAPE